MTSCKTNKKGIRLLATIAVFAMVFATVAVITDDSPDVEGTVAESDVAKIGEMATELWRTRSVMLTREMSFF